MLGFEVSNKRTCNGQNILIKKVSVYGAHFDCFSTQPGSTYYATLWTLDTVSLLTPTSLAMSRRNAPSKLIFL